MLGPEYPQSPGDGHVCRWERGSPRREFVSGREVLISAHVCALCGERRQLVEGLWEIGANEREALPL
jgi:hypothetical protein